MHEYFFEHLLDDEIGRAHLDPVRHLAVHRLLNIRVLQYDAQRRGPKATGRVQEKTRERREHRGFKFQWKIIKFAVDGQNIPLNK